MMEKAANCSKAHGQETTNQIAKIKTRATTTVSCSFQMNCAIILIGFALSSMSPNGFWIITTTIIFFQYRN